MADRIRISTEALEKWARDLLSVQSSMAEAASMLARLDLRKDAGRELRIYANTVLNNGVRIYGEDAGAILTSLENALKATGRSAGRVSKSMLHAAGLYEDTEEKIISRINMLEVAQTWQTAYELEGLSAAYDRTTTTFDDNKRNGTYGGDQGDMAHHKKGFGFFGYRWFEDEALFDRIRSYERYKDYSQDDIANLLDQINSEGCGYVAMVNNIFVEYEGRGGEFQKKFGFPMYDENGKANYNYLIIDFYARTDDRYYLNEPMGATAFVNDMILPYLDGREDEFRAKYGCDPLINGNLINPAAGQAILDEYKNAPVIEYGTSGTTTYSLENRFRHYMDQKGITCETQAISGNPMPTTEQINTHLNSGKNVNIAVGGFNLYTENGFPAATNVGDHWMTITGTTDDGRYIVSSWGKRYYLKPGELTNADFYLTDIKP